VSDSGTVRRYLDNAATSWPKPPEVFAAWEHAGRSIGAAAGRATYREAVAADAIRSRCRTAVARLLGDVDPERVAFPAGATLGLNMAIHGLLASGDHVIATAADHNATLRPLHWLEARGVIELSIVPCDGAGRVDPEAVARACTTVLEHWGGIDLVLWVAGVYQPMRAQNFELAAARRMLDTNLVSVFSGLSAILPVLIAQGSGGIALVSSVAGYSGLPQALVYGPTKAAMINLAESLYLDLRPAGIGVYLINPGYVDTPATAGNDYAMPGLISAREAADFTLAGIEAGHFEVHYPKRFTLWLKFARLLPYRLYFALVQRVTGS
jgi:NAD(P)-dependent dehydrogenase (short-subunit alcohol dehydrogenase family)